MKCRLPFFVPPILSLVAVCVVLNFFTLQALARFDFNPPADDTATDVSTMAAFLMPVELEIINEINLARANPQQYAAYLEKMRLHFVGNNYQPPGGKGYTFAEGVAALDDAIAFLRAASPLPPLQASQGMSLGARDHLKDLGMSGSTGHKGSDGSFIDQRVNRYGAWASTIGENISYTDETAREAVINMLIDDGNPSRGHRKNILNPTYRVAGVALGTRSAQGKLCIIGFAGGFVEKPAANQTTDKSKPVALKF